MCFTVVTLLLKTKGEIFFFSLRGKSGVRMSDKIAHSLKLQNHHAPTRSKKVLNRMKTKMSPRSPRASPVGGAAL